MKYLPLLLLITACVATNPDPELVRLFGKHCESLGHQQGTVEFNKCIKKIGEKK